MKNLLMIVLISISGFMANVSDAYDFYGASVSDKNTPSSYMKYGIHGYRPVINNVSYNSPASKVGLQQGNIILLINNKDIKRTSELSSVTTDIIRLTVFNGIERKNLIIDRLSIESEMANRTTTERKTTNLSHKNTFSDEQPDNSPPLKFDDAALEKKYGKSTYSPAKNNNYRIPNQIPMPQPTYSAPGFVGSGVIESQIDGEFEGWSGETIFKLVNGQIWQQSSYAYTYHYAYMPKVLIYNSSGSYKLKVDGVSSTINVTRLR